MNSTWPFNYPKEKEAADLLRLQFKMPHVQSIFEMLS